MSVPRLTAKFSIFKLRQPRGFDLVTRYYDPLKEARDERLKRVRAEADAEEVRAADRELLGARMRHSWQRSGSERASVLRLLLILGVVLVILYALAKRFLLI